MAINGEVFKTLEERQGAFNAFCNGNRYCVLCPCFNAHNNNKDCALAWLELDCKKPHRTMKEIVKELKEISTSLKSRSLNLFGYNDVTIKGKTGCQYFSDLANEIETAWNGRAK